MPPKKSLHQANNDDESDNKGHVVSVSFPSIPVNKRLEIDQEAIRNCRRKMGIVTTDNTEDPEGVVCSYVDIDGEDEVEECPEKESQKLRVLGKNIPISDSAAEILRGAISGCRVPKIIVKVRDVLPKVRFNFPNSEEEE